MNIADVNYLLYAVTGQNYHPAIPLEEAVESSLRGGVTVLQLREKELDSAGIADLGNSLRPICLKYNVPLIINDDVVAAMMCNADGVHVGQDDMSLSHARKLLGPDKIIGVSVTTAAEAKAAYYGSADYLGVGAVFPTGTKLDAAAVSYDELKAICEAVPIPVVAIGGITAENVAELSGSGIAGAAVVSAVYGAADIESAARLLTEKIGMAVKK